jgi:hypothetical protein
MICTDTVTISKTPFRESIMKLAEEEEEKTSWGLAFDLI